MTTQLTPSVGHCAACTVFISNWAPFACSLIRKNRHAYVHQLLLFLSSCSCRGKRKQRFLCSHLLIFNFGDIPTACRHLTTHKQFVHSCFVFRLRWLKANKIKLAFQVSSSHLWISVWSTKSALPSPHTSKSETLVCVVHSYRNVMFSSGEIKKPEGSAHVYEKPAAYLGPPVGTLKSEPTLILRKHSKAHFVEPLRYIQENRPEQLQTKRHKEKLKTATPLKSEKPIMGVRSDRSFITLNALNNIFSRPKKTPESQFDWTKKRDYGQVPRYLETVKKIVEKEYDHIEMLRQQGTKAEHHGSPHNGFRVLPDPERQELLAGLKKRWKELNARYQSTTHVILLDTIGKARRKEQLEEQLSTIERYIDKLNTGKSILVRSE